MATKSHVVFLLSFPSFSPSFHKWLLSIHNMPRIRLSAGEFEGNWPKPLLLISSPSSSREIYQTTIKIQYFPCKKKRVYKAEWSQKKKETTAGNLGGTELAKFHRQVDLWTGFVSVIHAEKKRGMREPGGGGDHKPRVPHTGTLAPERFNPHVPYRFLFCAVMKLNNHRGQSRNPEHNVFLVLNCVYTRIPL